MKVQTKLVTPVYSKPIPQKQFLKLNLIAFRDFTITEVRKLVNPFGGNKEEFFTFGKTSAGWLLMRHDNLVYVAEEACPTCLCEMSEEPSFLLPCCKNKLHAQCFIRQIDSFKSGLWRETHICCPLCRQNYFEGADRENQWFWVHFQPLRSIFQAWRGNPDFNQENFKNIILRNHRIYTSVKKLLKENDDALPEDERGGWAVKTCDLCQEPGIAGKLSCAEEMNIDLEARYVCDRCEWGKEAKDHRCFLHGKKYAMFKCDSCCSPATWDCFSNHYCERCHDMACATKDFPCPGPDKCPLGCAHPRNSHGRHEENDLGFVLGCFKCVDPTYEVNSSYSEHAPDPFRAKDIKNKGNLGMFQYSVPPPPLPKPVAEPIPEPEIQFIINAIPAANVLESVEEDFDPPEENEIYENYISQFDISDTETCSSESDSSVFIQLFEEDDEEQILPILAPRPMVHNFSCDSVFSEDNLNLLNFNRGFDCFDESEAEDIFLLSC